VPLAGPTDCAPTPLRRRAGRPQLKRDPLGSVQAMRATLLLILTALLFLPAAGLGQARSRPPAPRWCTDATQKGDSAFIVSRAIKAVADSARNRIALKVDDFQVIRTASLEQGVIVSLVAANPHARGGGGLVWVDTETLCPIILRLYE